MTGLLSSTLSLFSIFGLMLGRYVRHTSIKILEPVDHGRTVCTSMTFKDLLAPSAVLGSQEIFEGHGRAHGTAVINWLENLDRSMAYVSAHHEAEDREERQRRRSE